MPSLLFINCLFLISAIQPPNKCGPAVGGPRGGVCFASRSSAGAPAESAAMASRQPLLVCERGGCGAPAARYRLAALSQRPPACAVQGMNLFFLLLLYLHLYLFLL